VIFPFIEALLYASVINGNVLASSLVKMHDHVISRYTILYILLYILFIVTIFVAVVTIFILL